MFLVEYCGSDFEKFLRAVENLFERFYDGFDIEDQLDWEFREDFYKCGELVLDDLADVMGEIFPISFKPSFDRHLGDLFTLQVVFFAENPTATLEVKLPGSVFEDFISDALAEPRELVLETLSPLMGLLGAFGEENQNFDIAQEALEAADAAVEEFFDSILDEIYADPVAEWIAEVLRDGGFFEFPERVSAVLDSFDSIRIVVRILYGADHRTHAGEALCG